MEVLCHDVSVVVRSLETLSHRLARESDLLAAFQIDGESLKSHIAGLARAIDHEFDTVRHYSTLFDTI